MARQKYERATRMPHIAHHQASCRARKYQTRGSGRGCRSAQNAQRAHLCIAARHGAGSALKAISRCCILRCARRAVGGAGVDAPQQHACASRARARHARASSHYLARRPIAGHVPAAAHCVNKRATGAPLPKRARDLLNSAVFRLFFTATTALACILLPRLRMRIARARLRRPHSRTARGTRKNRLSPLDQQARRACGRSVPSFRSSTLSSTPAAANASAAFSPPRLYVRTRTRALASLPSSLPSSLLIALAAYITLASHLIPHTRLAPSIGTRTPLDIARRQDATRACGALSYLFSLLPPPNV